MPKTGRRVRLKDVADRAGVSSTTASFVLSGRDMRVSEETRRRVLRTAREMDYRPNLTARSLRTQVSSTIGLIADTIATGHYGGDLIRGAMTEALRREHLLLVCESGGDPALEATLAEDLSGRQVDGLIFATASHDRIEAPRSQHPGQRIVLLNCRDNAVHPAVVPDEMEGGRAAAQLLLDAGHRTGIWVVGESPPESLPGSERMQGITAALRAHGVELAGHLQCPWWPEGAFDALSSALDSGLRPAAIVCLNDRIAFGVHQALSQAGLRVPQDVSLVSFDDSELATWLRPALTTIALPEFEMGRVAVNLLLSDEPTTGVTRVPMPVRGRGSIAPPTA